MIQERVGITCSPHEFEHEPVPAPVPEVGCSFSCQWALASLASLGVVPESRTGQRQPKRLTCANYF